MIKAPKLRLKVVLDQMVQNNECRVKFQFETFNHEVKDVRVVAKERHLLFVQAAKKVQEDVNLKVEEIRKEMMQEVTKVDHNYYILHTKVYIVVDVVTKIVEYHTTINSKEFVHLQGVLADVKAMISKLPIPPTSTISQESISKMFSSLESRLKADLDPLLQLVNLIPRAAPPISIGVQGGDKGVGASKNLDHGEVVGKMSSTQIPTIFLVSTRTTSTTMTSKPLTKGIVNKSSTGGSSSKLPPSTEELKKIGKGILIEPTTKEKKLALEKEMKNIGRCKAFFDKD